MVIDDESDGVRAAPEDAHHSFDDCIEVKVRRGLLMISNQVTEVVRQSMFDEELDEYWHEVVAQISREHSNDELVDIVTILVVDASQASSEVIGVR